MAESPVHGEALPRVPESLRILSSRNVTSLRVAEANPSNERFRVSTGRVSLAAGEQLRVTLRKAASHDWVWEDGMKAQEETTLAKARAKAENAEVSDSDGLSTSMRKLIVSFTQLESDRTSSASGTKKEG